MRNPLKRTKKPPKPKKEKIYPPKDVVLVTTESGAELVPCTVNDDHTLKYGNKTVKIRDDRPAHILIIPVSKLVKGFLAKRFTPRKLIFNMYTVQKTGEVTHNPATTHDPHKDGLDEKQKMRFEKLIQIQAVSAKAAIAQNIMAGLKDKVSIWETLGALIAIVIIVAFFLFAFQVQPNL